jgi:hypothetical protein
VNKSESMSKEYDKMVTMVTRGYMTVCMHQLLDLMVNMLDWLDCTMAMRVNKSEMSESKRDWLVSNLVKQVSMLCPLTKEIQVNMMAKLDCRMD